MFDLFRILIEMKELVCFLLWSVCLCQGADYVPYGNSNYNNQGPGPISGIYSGQNSGTNSGSIGSGAVASIGASISSSASIGASLSASASIGVTSRPCSNFDIGCISQVYAGYTQCTPVRGSAPDPYQFDNMRVFSANANVSLVLRNANIRGLNDYTIKEFYVNEVTNRTVLEVEFSLLTLFSARADWSFYVRGREPINTRDYGFFIFKGLSLTLTLGNSPLSVMADAEVYAYLSEQNPNMSIGPGARPSDFNALRSYNEFMANIGLSLRESFIVQGPQFMSTFMQSCICDFTRKSVGIQAQISAGLLLNL